MAMHLTLESMAKDMAEKIIPFIQVNSYLDPYHMHYQLRAKLRVHVPSIPLEEQLKLAVPEYAKAVEAKMEV